MGWTLAERLMLLPMPMLKLWKVLLRQRRLVELGNVLGYGGRLHDPVPLLRRDD